MPFRVLAAICGHIRSGGGALQARFSLCTIPDESSPGQTRCFCRVCGSPIMSRTAARPGQVRVRVGTIESDIEERPMAHIFASSKANWDTIYGDLPRYDAYEPGRDEL